MARNCNFLRFSVLAGSAILHGDAICSRHSDCSDSLASLNSGRTYCCGGNFCCTPSQYSQGLKSDPFLSSTGALVGIVVGIMVFCLCVGVFLWCYCKGYNKRKIRKRNARQLALASYPGPYSEATLPGYSTKPKRDLAASHEYANPREHPEMSTPKSRQDHTYRNSKYHFDDIQWPDSTKTIQRPSRQHQQSSDHRRPNNKDPYSDSNARRKEHDSPLQKTGNVQYLGYIPSDSGGYRDDRHSRSLDPNYRRQYHRRDGNY